MADTGLTDFSGMSSLANVEQAEFSSTAFLADLEQVEEMGVGYKAGTSQTSVIQCWQMKQAWCYYPPYPQIK